MSLEVVIEHLGSVQFEVKARHLTLLSDQPAGNGGFDEGMTPPELLLASLGTCAGYYAAQYLRKAKVSAPGTLVRVAADKVKDPARLDRFRIEVEVPIELNESHRSGLRHAVEQCLIHNTLLHPPAISLTITGSAPAQSDAGLRLPLEEVKQ